MKSVPKEMIGKYNEISALLTDFCAKFLNEEYETLCLHALEKLCRKRPSPLNSGKAATWAAGIVYAIGSNNFIFDKSQKIQLTGNTIASHFGIASSTAYTKAKQIKDMLKINYSKSEWCLPSTMANNPMIWLVTINGVPVDARYLSPEMQQICYSKGWIPYIPALPDE